MLFFLYKNEYEILQKLIKLCYISFKYEIFHTISTTKHKGENYTRTEQIDDELNQTTRFACRDKAMAASKIMSMNTTTPPNDPMSEPDAPWQKSPYC